jgi:hypothetical protein
MNSYISLMLEAEGAKDRLQRLFQSTPEVKKNDSTIFIFFRQGFHFQNGVLVLGRRRG